MAKKYGCQITCLNLSETQNKRNRKINKKNGLDNLITVVEGNFENIPFCDNKFDVIWSQDALVHSTDRIKAVSEVNRILRTDGEFIFTDLMQRYGCTNRILKPVLDRLHLDSLGSLEFYLQEAKKLGMKKTEIQDLSANLTIHYRRVRDETKKHYQTMVDLCGKEYIDKMIQGLNRWVEAGRKNLLVWGLLHFKKTGYS